MEKYDFLKFIYKNSIYLFEGVYEDVIDGNKINITIKYDKIRGKIVIIRVNDKTLYKVIKNSYEMELNTYFDNYTLYQFYNYNSEKIFDEEIVLADDTRNIISENSVNYNELSFFKDFKNNELVYRVNDNIKLSYNYDDGKVYLYILTNHARRIVFDEKFIKNYKEFISTNNKVLKEKLSILHVEEFFDSIYNFKDNWFIDEEFLKDFKYAAKLYEVGVNYLDKLHDDKTNDTICKFMDLLNNNIKYARLNALNYYMSNNILDTNALNEIYREIKSIRRSKNDEKKLKKTRKPLRKYQDIDN